MSLRPSRGAARLLNLHSGFVMVSTQVAGAFFAVYLLKIGFSLAVTFLAIGAVLAVRFALRFLVLWLVPRLGLRRSLALGTFMRALQFVPLAYATHVPGLIAWIGLSALADALYWPLYHTVVAGVGEPETRGSQVGALEAIRSLTGIIGPALGGWLMAGFGSNATFAIGAALQLGALWPVLALPDTPTGPVPSVRESLKGDRLGFLIFVSDGLVQIGWFYVWSLALFMALKSSFEFYGGAMAVSGLVAAVVGFSAGRVLDRGHGGRLLYLVTLVMLAGITARMLAIGNGPASFVVNAFSVVALSLYTPTVMNTMYNRAHRLGPLRFHFFTESGWDIGGILGCLMAALVATLGGSLSYAMLPSLLGALAIHRCVSAAERQFRRPGGLAAEQI